MDGCCCERCHDYLAKPWCCCCKRFMRLLTGRFPWTSGLTQFYTPRMFESYEESGRVAAASMVQQGGLDNMPMFYDVSPRRMRMRSRRGSNASAAGSEQAIEDHLKRGASP